MKFIFSARFIIGFFTGVASIVSLYALFLLNLPRINEALRPRIQKEMAAPFLPNMTEAEFDWTLQDLGGDDFDLAALRGKTVFLTVWRSGCPICVAELSYLQSLYEKTREDAIEFVIVSTEQSERILDLVVEFDLTYPIYTYEGERPALYSTGKTPSTFVIAPDGKLAFRWVGAARWDDEAFINYLRGLSLMGQNPVSE
ncbi:MAG: TlpA disulfide reductase family protein [Candidatus Hydrogenedentes bacterium]|jgi:peroxiredoxin|nr:TlpA disulfide reductase family protein [Candidatus Hydrogenedentota bacterium]